MSDAQTRMRSRNQSSEATESQVIRRVLLLLAGLPTGKAQSSFSILVILLAIGMTIFSYAGWYQGIYSTMY